MAIKLDIKKWQTCYPSKLLAQNGGQHIVSIKVSSDTPNGVIVGKGDFIDLDSYEETTPTKFKGVVLKESPAGRWYVEVTEAENAYLIYQKPLIAEEYNNQFKDERNFYTPQNGYARAYCLAVGDVFELSTDGFNGTPKAKEKIDSVETRQPKIASEAA